MIRSTLELRAREAMRLAVVADTHGKPHPAMAAMLRAEAPDAILHGGDIGDLTVLDRLAEIAPVLAVRGNIDGHGPAIPDARTVTLTRDGGVLAVILLMHIGVNGPRLRADAARLAQAEGASLVVCGHSHVPLLARERDVVVFNPGSIGPRRFQLPIVFGVIEVGAAKITLRHVDAETGEQWTPAGSGRATMRG